MNTRVLVVDDTALFRRLVSEALSGLPGVEVIGTAGGGTAALSKLETLRPDLMTLDLEMPGMDGLAVLDAMMPVHAKTGVIVVSAHTMRGGAKTVQALERGAFDFVRKPEGSSAAESLTVLRDTLGPLIRAFQRQQGALTLPPRLATPPSDGPRPANSPAVSSPSARLTGPPLVLIGVSTGGPAALAEVVPALPATLAAPVFIVQHMPPLFTQALADRLSNKCSLPVREGVDGEVALRSHVYIAPGGRQMKLAPGPSGEILIRITDDPPENNCRPAVDCLFRSVALHFPGRAIAAILTGMGNDGAKGLTQLRRGGCISIAQDQATSVVFGMPREAIASGAVDRILPLDQIGPAIARAVQEATPC